MTKPYTMSQYASKDDLYTDMRADIEALKAENEKLREALEQIHSAGGCMDSNTAWTLAKKALNKGPMIRFGSKCPLHGVHGCACG